MMVKRNGTVADYITQAFLLLLQKNPSMRLRLTSYAKKRELPECRSTAISRAKRTSSGNGCA